MPRFAWELYKNITGRKDARWAGFLPLIGRAAVSHGARQGLALGLVSVLFLLSASGVGMYSRWTSLDNRRQWHLINPPSENTQRKAETDEHWHRLCDQMHHTEQFVTDFVTFVLNWESRHAAPRHLGYAVVATTEMASLTTLFWLRRDVMMPVVSLTCCPVTLCPTRLIKRAA